MKDLSEVPTFILIEMCKGLWYLQPTLKEEFVTDEMKKWCEDAKKTMIVGLKKELESRVEHLRPKPIHEPKSLLQAYADHIRKMWSQE